MKSDINRLLSARSLDALVAMGGSHDPNLFYLMNGAPIHEGAIVVQRREHEIVLCHGSMERGEAAKTGLKTRDLGQYDFNSILDQAGGDRLRASVRFLKLVLEDEHVRGRVVFLGRMDQGAAYALLSALETSSSDIEVVGEYGRNVVTEARRTKSTEETEHIAAVSRACGRVIERVRAFLSGADRTSGILKTANGKDVLIGDVRRQIRTWLLIEGLEDTGTIFSQGRDAGFPHSRGEDDEPIRTGVSIVFDIFPRPVGGGYHTDITRTWCIGPAPAELRSAYDAVLEAYRASTAALVVGRRCSDLQGVACDVFERYGHATPRSNPGTHVGYVHSLGHGVGLEVHEEPRLSHFRGNDDVIEAGMVFSIEPGLYYPDNNIGVRLEDTWSIDETGRPHNLTPSSLELEI